MPKYDTVLDALKRGETDARLLDGRDFNGAYWRNARRQLSNLRRELERLRRERDSDPPTDWLERLRDLDPRLTRPGGQARYWPLLCECAVALNRIAYGDQSTEDPAWTTGRSWRKELARRTIAPIRAEVERDGLFVGEHPKTDVPTKALHA